MEDLISRQAAIDILDAFRVKVENGEDFAYSWARMRMTELPSVQPFEDIHREKEQAYYCGYEDGAKAARSALRRKKMKGAEDE